MPFEKYYDRFFTFKIAFLFIILSGQPPPGSHSRGKGSTANFDQKDG